MKPGQELAGLAEGAGRVLHQPVVGLRHLEEVVADAPVILTGGHLAGEIHVPPHPDLHPLDESLLVAGVFVFRRVLGANQFFRVVNALRDLSTAYGLKGLQLALQPFEAIFG